MFRYYLSLEPNEDGRFWVHILFCEHGVELAHRKNVGFHLSCRTAVEAAKKSHPDKVILGCPHCCPECSEA